MKSSVATFDSSCLALRSMPIGINAIHNLLRNGSYGLSEGRYLQDEKFQILCENVK